MNRSSSRAFLLIPLLLACFALSPQVRATCQEGCLTNFNTVLGDDALISNTTGNANTAAGFEALFSNTTGFSNIAIGWSALYSNTTGFANIAIGLRTLYSNSAGAGNTATGAGALYSNTSGDNTATGYEALFSNSTGEANTAMGDEALLFNTTGSSNIALGYQAGLKLTTGSNNIDIGNPGFANESSKIRIGTNGTHTNTFIAGISGVTVADGVGVIIDGRGHLGTVVSSARFKESIKPMDKASEAILALKPVAFRYKKELDPEGIPQFGLVAEDVEKVNPDLVARDAQGKPYTVRYEAVNAMLLNEFLKARRQINAQQRQIEALTAGLQEVKAQVETSRLTPQTVVSNR